MCQNDEVPFSKKQAKPGLAAKVQAAVAADAAVRDYDLQRKTRVAARAEAINDALEAGATLRTLAVELGVSTERVRQMRHGN